jgi:nucleoid-associated protein YgaU
MTTITIEAGDTLWDLAEKHLGAGGAWVKLWALNGRVIEQTKANHAAWRDRRWQGPHWIFPGMTLNLPAGTTPA